MPLTHLKDHEYTDKLLTVTRSHKANDRDHKGIAEGTISPMETVPRFFGKNGFADVDPKKVKKDGSGRGNWYVHSKTPMSVSPTVHLHDLQGNRQR